MVVDCPGRAEDAVGIIPQARGQHGRIATAERSMDGVSIPGYSPEVLE